eukprot:m.114360 g.114360  ORF g.114360 m.114360 type:complete len:446 (+) comp37491_c0_seq3:504-1841(+)
MFPSFRNVAVVSQKKKFSNLLVVLFVLVCHWLTTTLVIRNALGELGSSVGMAILVVVGVTIGLFFLYYHIFAANTPFDHESSSRPVVGSLEAKNLAKLRLNEPTAEDLVKNVVGFVVFIVVFSVVMYSCDRFVSDSYENRCIPESNGTVNPFRRRAAATPTTPQAPYDLCTRDWYGLSVLDLALLSHVAYKDENTVEGDTGDCSQEASQYMTRYFPPSRWQWKITHQSAASERVGFYEIYFPVENVTVIAVRGTRFSRHYARRGHVHGSGNASICLSLFVPIILLLPSDTIQQIVHDSSFVERAFYDSARYYYTPLNRHMAQRGFRAGDRVVVTGHSLGGTVAKIAASKFKVRTVAFNSPGLIFSQRKFNLTSDDIHRSVVNVFAKNDVVSKIDKLGGNTNRIDCSKKSIITCHRITNMACDLEQFCGFHSPDRRLLCSPNALND